MTIRAMQAPPPVIALLDSIQPPMQFGRARRFARPCPHCPPSTPFSQARTEDRHESMGCFALHQVHGRERHHPLAGAQRGRTHQPGRPVQPPRRHAWRRDHGAGRHHGRHDRLRLARPNQATATIESKTNFFAPIPRGDKVRAVCTPLHSGRTTIVLQTNITRSDGRLAAMVTQTQIVLPKSGVARQRRIGPWTAAPPARAVLPPRSSCGGARCGGRP